MIQVVLADPHTIFRDCLSQCFNQFHEVRHVSASIKCISAHGSIVQAADDAINRKADILLVNIHIPGPSAGVEIARAKSMNRRLKAIAYARTPEPEYLYQLRHFGFEGMLLKSDTFEHFRNVIVRVSQGQTCFPNGCEIPTKPGHLSDLLTLTPRERSVFKLLAEGNSVKQIATIIGLAAKTVEVHKFNLYNKLGLRNRAQLITYAVARKVIQLEHVETPRLEAVA